MQPSPIFTNTFWCLGPTMLSLMLLPTLIIMPIMARDIRIVMRNANIHVFLHTLSFVGIGVVAYYQAAHMDEARLEMYASGFRSNFLDLAVFSWITSGAIVVGWLLSYKRIEAILSKPRKVVR